LHALGTPPAFILSQDQTLHLRSETPAGPEARGGVSRRSSVALEPHEFDHPSRTDRGDGRYRGPTLHRSRLIRYPDAPRNRSEEASPLRDGVLALAFHTLLSFQGTSPGCSSATHLRFPRPVTAGAAGRYHGPFKIVKDFPPARSAYSWWSTTRHVVTFTQKRRPAPPPAGRQDGHRPAVGRILLALGDLLSSDADAVGVVRRGPRSRRTSLLAAWRR
jgi:hypothetical protein